MGKLQGVLNTIGTNLKGLSQTQKLLIASLCVIVAMTLFLVMQYAGRGQMVELMADDPQQRILMSLRAAGFDAESKDGKVMVSPADRSAAIAALSQTGDLPSDSTVLFNNLIGTQDWRNSAEKDKQQYIFALQNELGRVISQFRDVASASVIMHAPDAPGLGRAAREPTASVTVFTSTGGPLPQATVDAVARLVAGSRAGLKTSNVSVIDGTTGRPRKVTDDSDLVSSNYLEHQTVVERETREKLEALLAYIPGVMVAVTAQVDVTRISSQTQKHLPKNEGTISLPRRSESSSTSQSETSNAAEPGMRSIAAMDINSAGSGSGTKMEQEDATEEFQNAIGVEVTNKQDPRGMPTALAASINIPEDYVEQLVRKAKGGADQGEVVISREDLEAKFAEIEKQVASSIQPHLRTRLDDGSVNAGEVFVSMVPIALLTPGSASEAGIMGVFSSGPLALANGGIVEKVVLAALAVVALAMMLMMIKRSGKPMELPTAQELVGVPPALEFDSDVIGEAEERDAPMAGIEIDDDEVKVQKMLEQVAELVAQNPDGAAGLLQRWIQVEE